VKNILYKFKKNWQQYFANSFYNKIYKYFVEKKFEDKISMKYEFFSRFLHKYIDISCDCFIFKFMV